MKIFNGVLNLAASLITIFNVFLALPSIFENVELSFFTEITERNFALKFGFILILQFGLGYIHSTSLQLLYQSNSVFTKKAFALILVLVMAWLTIFNITEILYGNKDLESSIQYLGLFFFLVICYFIHSILLTMARGEYVFFRQSDEILAWVIILGILNLMLFIVYWING